MCKVNSPKYIAMTLKRTPIRRAPRGVLSSKPVYMRLMSDERRELEQIAHGARCSHSSIARQIYLLGVAMYRSQLNQCATQPLATSCVEG